MSNLKDVAQRALLAWNTVCGAQGWDPMHLEQFVRLREALTKPDDEAQPVAHVAGDDMQRYLQWSPEVAVFSLPIGTSLYTAAQPKERKPLTDEQIMDICSSGWLSHPIEVARGIEEAHGITNKESSDAEPS